MFWPSLVDFSKLTSLQERPSSIIGLAASKNLSIEVSTSCSWVMNDHLIALKTSIFCWPLMCLSANRDSISSFLSTCAASRINYNCYYFSFLFTFRNPSALSFSIFVLSVADLLRFAISLVRVSCSALVRLFHTKGSANNSATKV